MDINLIVFIVWMTVIIYLGAREKTKAFNREFVGLLMTGAFLFHGLINEGLFVTVMLAYLGIRTFQKKMENNKK